MPQALDPGNKQVHVNGCAVCARDGVFERAPEPGSERAALASNRRSDP